MHPPRAGTKGTRGSAAALLKGKDADEDSSYVEAAWGGDVEKTLQEALDAQLSRGQQVGWAVITNHAKLCKLARPATGMVRDPPGLCRCALIQQVGCCQNVWLLSSCAGLVPQGYFAMLAC